MKEQIARSMSVVRDGINDLTTSARADREAAVSLSQEVINAANDAMVQVRSLREKLNAPGDSPTGTLTDEHFDPLMQTLGTLVSRATVLGGHTGDPRVLNRIEQQASAIDGVVAEINAMTDENATPDVVDSAQRGTTERGRTEPRPTGAPPNADLAADQKKAVARGGAAAPAPVEGVTPSGPAPSDAVNTG